MPSEPIRFHFLARQPLQRCFSFGTRILILRVLLSLLCGVAFAETPAEKAAAAAKPVGPHKLALLVGINNYERPGIGLPWPNLSCDTDLATLRHLLISRFGFAPADILTLTNAQATKAGIVKAFREHLTAQAHPGDILLFHFSGHGQPVADDNGDELDGLDESLVPYDYISQSARDGAKTNLRDDQVGELLSELRKKLQGPDGEVKGNITVFLDSCHSGTATRGQSPRGRLRVRGRGWNTAIDGPKPAPRTRGAAGETSAPAESASGLFMAGGARAQGYVVFSACESDQLAQETENEQGKDMGAFTYFLTRSLARATPGTTYRDVFEKLNVEMTGAVENQNPQLEGDIDKALFADATLPVPAYFVVSGADSEGFTLPLGSLQGLTQGSRFAIFKAGSDVSQETNRLGEAEVVGVDTVSSRARLQPEYAARVKPEALQAARAVETSRNYGTTRLKVCLDASVGEDSPTLTAQLAKVTAVTSEGVTDANYDVRIRRDGNQWIVERSSGSVIVTLAVGGTPAALREALLGEWRWRFLTRLQNDNPRSLVKMEIRLVPVDVETDNTGRVTKVTGDRQPTAAPDANDHVFHDGDFVMLELRNPADADAYVTVLDLSADGTINPVFPHPDAPGVFDNKIPPDNQWHRIVGTADNPFVLRLGAPFGNELFKAIATRDNADFSSLVTVSGSAQRGDVLAQLPPEFNPLGELLLAGISGKQRGSSFAGVPPSNWATADFSFVVQPH